jgi:hypothetical protein
MVLLERSGEQPFQTFTIKLWVLSDSSLGCLSATIRPDSLWLSKKVKADKKKVEKNLSNKIKVSVRNGLMACGLER